MFLFDVAGGNPNGNPHAGNRPRSDEEPGHGLVTDVALKRKIRDTLSLVGGDDPRYGVFVHARYVLDPRLEESYAVGGLKLDAKVTPEQAATARAWLCDRAVPAGDVRRARPGRAGLRRGRPSGQSRIATSR